MVRASPTPAVAADAAAVTEIVMALETSFYGQTTYSQADLENEWSDLDLEQNARVVRDGGRIVGYGVLRELGALWRTEGYVHPDAHGRGIGRLIATGLEEEAALGGARRVQNSVFEVDSAARALLESLGYGAARIFREMRIELEAQPPAPRWPDGLRVVSFDPERDALEFHAAGQEAFSDHWDHTPRPFEAWSQEPPPERALRPVAVVRRARGGRDRRRDDLHGRDLRRRLGPRALHASPVAQAGVGAALLGDAFGRFWERGERSVGLGVDAANDTGAFRLYERAGMTPALGWVIYEKPLGDAA